VISINTHYKTIRLMHCN